jgi:hypothetical protein
MKILFNNLAGRQLVFLLLAKVLLCPTTTQAAEPETAGARAEETSRYHTLLETLVFTGLAEPGTVNANIEVYRSILGSVVRDAGIAERAHTPAQARVRPFVFPRLDR